MFEALLSQLPDWWLLHPTSGAEVAALLQAQPARTVVWLDELQRYLDGPDRLTAATVRALLHAGVVVVGTIWPREYDARMALADPGGAEEADNRALLDLAKTLAKTVVVPAAFTRTELARAQVLARVDERLDIAVHAGGPGVTQILAAAPDVQRRWEHADDPYGAAVITAAVDARRLGMQALVTREHLAEAVPGYLTWDQQAEAPADWLERAVTYATTKVRGAASALVPDSGGVMGQVRGYRAADYLLQRGFQTRRAAVLPDSALRSLVTHATDPTDVRRLAYSADTRWRYTYAIQLYSELAAAGDEGAARRLADIVAVRSSQQAIEVLRPFANTSHIAGQLTDLMASTDDLDGLRRAAEGGDLVAGCRLVHHLGASDLDQVRAAAAWGDRLAVGWLIDHDGDDQHFDRLRDRADAGDRLARGRLAEALADRQQADQAIQLLATSADRGDRLAAEHLADLLIRHGRTDQLQARANAGDDAEAIEHLKTRAAAGDDLAAGRLPDLLRETGRHEELRSLAQTDPWYASGCWARYLAATGRLDEAIQWLSDQRGPGADLAASDLADLLVEQGRIEDALDVLRPFTAGHGDGPSVNRLVALLGQHNRVDDLRMEVNAGASGAMRQLLHLLLRGDAIDPTLVARTHQEGLTAGWPHDGSPP